MPFIRQGINSLPNEIMKMLKKGNTYYELYYHIVFSTKNRASILTIDRIMHIREIAKNKSAELGFLLHILNGYNDHIHILATIPPALAIANVIKHIKGVSSRTIEDLYWQEGYWIKAIEKENIKKIANYIENQQTHHKNQNKEEWEKRR